ncbi:MFS transporter [Catenuloplanes atrovinosus]|uniref:MFS family permease n=1 Tax=Catenuloplanes atrovinosus TaxID=137266 RepID=A0AAE3YV87_9ACTN|nr:MFS transporter [Catenuloplanes atrovinosus]MDR7280519.1 MFS family permease [Catenuloplanes atrovinosus]
MRRWLRDNVGGLPGTFWYLWTGMLITRAGGFVVLFLSLYLTAERGASPSLAGLLIGAYGVGGAAGSLLSGVLTDRWGRRRTLITAYLAMVATMVALAFTTPLPAIGALVGLLGLVQSMPGPALIAAMVDVVPEADRPRAFNLEYWALNLGTAIASLLAGQLAEASYTALFLVDAASTAAALALVVWRVPETFTASRTPSAAGGGFRRVARDRHFLAFTGLTLLFAVVVTQAPTIMPIAMAQDGLGPSAYGRVMALGALLIIVGQLFVPRLIGGHRKHRVLALAAVLAGLGYGALAFADHLWFYLVAAVAWNVGQMLAAPPNAQINAELAPPALRGRYQSVFYLTFPAAAFIAPAAGGFALEHLGDPHWVIAGGLGLVAAGLHLLAGPGRERHVAALRARPEPDIVRS